MSPDNLLKNMGTQHGLLSITVAEIKRNADILGIEEIGTDADHKIWVRTTKGEKYSVRFVREFKL